jgi:alkylation response protein AidB-like acyl-CoA dehydrogenase
MTSTVQGTAPAGSELVDIEARVADLLSRHDPAATAPAEWLGHQFDAGLAWVNFPPGCGGLGLPRCLQPTVNRMLAAAGAPRGVARNPIGYGMGAPTVLTHGTDAQRRRYLRPLFTCEEIWCQLFSEPGAGSDVAGLATRAERDGDEWVVNGQKVWTTLAHTARFGMLLARTHPEAEKHKGLTYFVVDMRQPGVEVRPLRQMTGDAEFNEVYFTDARIPDSERLGGVGDGWRTAITTLMNERVSIGSTTGPRGGGPIAAAVRLFRQRAGGDPVFGDRLVQLWIRAEVQRLTSVRAAVNAMQGTPGPEGSTVKLAGALNNQSINELCVDLMGPEGMLYDSYQMRRPADLLWGADPQRLFVRSVANSIEGGTSEILRNIIGERVLGLPGDVRVDKGVAWSQVARS